MDRRGGDREQRSGKERRRVRRFEVVVRVDYAVGGRRGLSLTSNLNTHGLRLRGAGELEVGQQLDVELRLGADRQPVQIAAVVRNLRGGSAGLEFVPGHEKAMAAIRRYLDAEVISKLEARLARSVATTSQVDLLAGWYLEVGRLDDAVALYRRALLDHPEAVQLQLGLARALLDRASGQGPEAVRALGELEAHLERAPRGPALEELDELRARAADLRGGGREAQATPVQADLDRAKVAPGTGERERIRAAVQSALAARTRTLEELERELVAERQALVAERKELETLRGRYVQAELALAGREEALASGRRELEARTRALDERARLLRRAPSSADDPDPDEPLDAAPGLRPRALGRPTLLSPSEIDPLDEPAARRLHR